MKPGITFITPTFNRDAEIVRRCLDCVRLQTVSNWEQILYSDGQVRPELRALAERDKRCRYIEGTQQLGRVDGPGNGPRRICLEQTETEYVCFFDDDNVIVPEYAEKNMQALQRNPGAGFALCRIVHFGPLSCGRSADVLHGHRIEVGWVDTLQLVARTEMMRRCGWCQTGYCADGHTIEALAKLSPAVCVEQVLGFHL